jgi:hypothetical protein
MKKPLTNLQIIEILRGINSITESDTKYPVSFLWKVNGNIKKLSAINDRIAEEEQRINSEYSTEERSISDENGVRIKEEFQEGFVKEKTELFSIENNIEIDTLAFADIEHLEFSPAEFASLEFMLDDGCDIIE